MEVETKLDVSLKFASSPNPSRSKNHFDNLRRSIRRFGVWVNVNTTSCASFSPTQETSSRAGGVGVITEVADDLEQALLCGSGVQAGASLKESNKARGEGEVN